MTSGSRAAITRRIAALLAKAESTDFEHEAQLLAEKARELMQRYQIEQHELGVDADPLGAVMIPLRDSAHAYAALATKGAEYFGCRTTFRVVQTFSGGRHRHYRLFGRESARAVAELMIDYWTVECVRRGRRLHREGRYTSASTAVRQVLLAMASRLHRMAERSPPAGPPGLPVPLAEADVLLRQMVPNPGTMRRTVRNTYDRVALSEAMQIPVSDQIGSPRSSEVRS